MKSKQEIEYAWKSWIYNRCEEDGLDRVISFRVKDEVAKEVAFANYTSVLSDADSIILNRIKRLENILPNLSNSEQFLFNYRIDFFRWLLI